MPYDPKSRKPGDTHLYDKLSSYHKERDDLMQVVVEPVRFQRVLHEGELDKKQRERARDIGFREREVQVFQEAQFNNERSRWDEPTTFLPSSKDLQPLAKFQSRNNGSERGRITSERGPGVLPIVSHMHDSDQILSFDPAKWHIEQGIRTNDKKRDARQMAVGPNAN